MPHQDVVEDNKNREWNNSRPLDVHRWSDYPEVNSFVNALYDAYFTDDNGNHNIRKKHMWAYIFVSHFVSHHLTASGANAYKSIGYT